MDGDEPTQATQNVLDPRRVGKQNSGFSDDDVSDIICVLYPQNGPARHEVQRLAQEGSPHIIAKQQADGIEPDYNVEDQASRFGSDQTSYGDHFVKLCLSAHVKNPAAGFAFGRNAGRCDIVFVNDPQKRISNVHFRIYVNEHGNVMIEDQSTNGTFVDSKLLCSKPKNGANPLPRWVLTSGCSIRVLLHNKHCDLTFLVRIPRRDDLYERAYIEKVDAYFALHGLEAAPRAGGHVDLFKTPHDAAVRRTGIDSGPAQASLAATPKPKKKQAVTSREWTGSDDYNVIKKIGQGAFAVVYKVTSKFNGVPHAAKEIEKRRFVKNGILDHKLENEIKIMRRVHHPHIVRYTDALDWEDRLLIIIMEFVPGGDLGKHVSGEGPLSEDRAQTVAKQLLSALGYLHANNITHRDVKPDNILINTLEPLDVRLTDFGLSKIVDTEKTFLTTFCGTLLYCAPEVYTEFAEYDDKGRRIRAKVRRPPGQRYSHAVDVWSLGGVLFYALTGVPPYPVKSGLSHSELLHKIMTTKLDISPLERHQVSQLGIEFLHRLLQRRPEKRASIPELESHDWLEEAGLDVEPSQSYDVLTDDEDDTARGLSSLHPADRLGDWISDAEGDEFETENTFAPPPTPPARFFGDVHVSAVGSSVALPADLVVARRGSADETEILDSQQYSGDDLDDSVATRAKDAHARAYLRDELSVFAKQYSDQLQSLVEDVASQSLSGTHSRTRGATTSLNSPFQSLVDASSSKRKPSPHEISDPDPFDENAPPDDKPLFKRLKSGEADDVPEDALREFKLLAWVPQIKRLVSGRQIDRPVNKISYWEQDRATWHLQYPEMTQLQYDAFSQAARDRQEELAPGKTPLWDLAMKYFPPRSRGSGQNAAAPAPLEAPPASKRGGRALANDTLEMPSTAAPPTLARPSSSQAQIPDTQIVVPVQADSSASRAIAVVESLPDSCITGISFPMTDSLASFGRSPENTEVFKERQEPRVPKCAFKVMLWKEGFDPSKDPSKTKPPWQLPSTADDASYHFWISTKATLGIRINGCHLASSDAKNPNTPSLHWTRIYDGDLLVIWGGQDSGDQTKLVFRCLWGGSSKPRAERPRQLELASPGLAQKLDNACRRTEKRMREAAERRRLLHAVETEHQERLRQVDRERERSHAFEKKRLEAVDYLASLPRPGQRLAASDHVAPLAQASRLQGNSLASRPSR